MKFVYKMHSAEEDPEAFASEDPEETLDEEALFEELLASLEQEDLSEEDIAALRIELPEMLQGLSPETLEYIRNLGPHLERVIDQVGDLKADGKIEGAVNVLVDFIENQEKVLEKIPDENLRNQILGMIGVLLDLDSIEKELGQQAKLEVLSAGIDLIPVVGSVKMLTEATMGKTAAGEKLEGKDRAKHAAWATAFVALDAIAVAGLVTGGTVSAAAEGGKVAVRAGTVATKGAKAGKIITRTAAFCRKVGKAGKTTKSVRTLFRVGSLMRKYPRIAGTLIKIVEKKRTVDKVRNINNIRGKLEKNTDPTTILDQDLPSAA